MLEANAHLISQLSVGKLIIGGDMTMKFVENLPFPMVSLPSGSLLWDCRRKVIPKQGSTHETPGRHLEGGWAPRQWASASPLPKAKK